MPKKKLTCKKMYKKLRKQYAKDYKGHFRDMYDGHNYADRMATKYAIKHTVSEWRRQYDAT